MSLFYLAKNLKNDKETLEFIKQRLEVLDSKESMEVGAETPVSIYSDFFNKKTKFNVGTMGVIDRSTGEINKIKYSSVKYDDDNMYMFLMDQIKEKDNPYDAIYAALRNYLYPRGLSKKTMEKRRLVYRYLSAPFNKPVSIKTIHKLSAAACAEIAGAAQNMFKFLDIESDCIIAGGANSMPHSFNVVYPEGRNKYAVLFDASIDSVLHPTMYLLDEKRRRELFTNKIVMVTDKDLSKLYKKLLHLQTLMNPCKDDYCILKDASVKTAMFYKNNRLNRRLI